MGISIKYDFLIAMLDEVKIAMVQIGTVIREAVVRVERERDIFQSLCLESSWQTGALACWT